MESADHCIALRGIVEFRNVMLEKKKRYLNGQGSRVDTSLTWVIRSGNDLVVRLLLEKGDIRSNVIVWGGRTVFSFAAESRNGGAMELLLERGNVNPGLPNDDGRTPPYTSSPERTYKYNKTTSRPPGHQFQFDRGSDSGGPTPLSSATPRGDEG